MEDIIIQPFKSGDAQGVREIAWQTAFVGKPGSFYFDDQEILSDFLTRYFIECEPESCFVARAGNRVVGYLIGARDANRMNQVIQWKMAPALIGKALRRGVFLKLKNLKFLSRCVLSLMKGEFWMPDFFKEYPAVLHINIQDGFRHSGIGARLMEAYFVYLRQKGVVGVCLATMSEDARLFFEKEGFALIYQGHRSYFRYLLKRDLPLYIFGKKLS